MRTRASRADSMSMSPSSRSRRGELALHPFLRQAAIALGQMLEHAADQPRVLVLRGLAEVGGLADLPQARQIGAVAAAADDEFVGGELAQRRLVLALVGEPEARLAAAARPASA